MFNGADGTQPQAPLVQGTDGNLYGTTFFAPGGCGEVFRITTAGKLTVLHLFDSGSGCGPVGPLVQGNDGNFYGTTEYNSPAGGPFGSVFKIAPTGTFTVLHVMNGGTDGGNIYAGVVQGTDGNLYGVASNEGNSSNCSSVGCGTTFKVAPNGSFSLIHNFDNTTGSAPEVTLFQHTNGTLYGDTYCGGTGINGLCGTDTTSGVFYSFNASLKPFVSLVNPSGKVTATVEILGQSFTGTTGVSFNGTATTFKVVTDTFMTAAVPSGATTGTVKVTTPGGTLTSNKKFRVTPQVLSFSPPSGPAGTVVTITGVSLTQTLGVGFGDHVPATFTVNSDTQVTATVPTGAKTGPVGVETQGGTAISSTPFTVTP